MPRIERVETRVLRIPVKIRLSYGKVRETNRLIVKVYTDNGVVGIGEGTPYLINIYESNILCKNIARILPEVELFKARDILIEMEKSLMGKPFFDFGPFLAFETAIIDAISKLNKTSFSKMLGGTFRDKIPVSGTVFLNPPRIMAKVAQKWVSKGITHLKVKITGKKDEDSVNLKSIRDSVGYEVLIRVDANQAYRTVDKAVDGIKRIEKYNVAIVEQPIKWNDLNGLRKLKRLVDPKIMIDESLRKPSDVELIATSEAADIINIHPSKLGCLSITKDAIEKIIDLGLEYMIGSAVLTGIGVAAHLHLAASIKELHYPNEEIGLYEMFGRDIVTNPLRIANGCIETPKNFGVGVSINESELERYSVNMDTLKVLLTRTGYKTYSKSPTFVKSILRRVSWIARR